eukprot:127594_1
MPDLQSVLIGTAHLTASVVCLTVLLSLWYEFRVKELKIRSMKLLIYTVVGISLNGLTSISVITIGFTKKNQSEDNSLTIISANIFRLAQIFVWLVFIKRLKISFINTKYQISKYIYYIFYTLIFIFVISNMVYTIFYAIIYSTGKQNVSKTLNNMYKLVDVIDLWLEQIIDLIMTVSLLYLYSNKLYILNMDIGMKDPVQLKFVQRYSIAKSQSQFDDEMKTVKASIDMKGVYEYKRDENSMPNMRNMPVCLTISFNKLQQQVLKAMSKNTLLSGSAIIFTQFIAIYLAVNSELYEYGKITENRNKYYDGWLIFIWAIGVMINVMSMFLSFDFNSEYYYKLCDPFDKCCFYSCQHCVGRQMKNHVVKQTELGEPLLITKTSELL